MTQLSERECKPCSGEESPLKGAELQEMADQLDDNWDVVDEHHLERAYKFDNWRQAVDFTNKIAELAEKDDHHPDVLLSYGKVEITLFTHKIGGLSENDFVLAAKIEDAFKGE